MAVARRTVKMAAPMKAEERLAPCSCATCSFCGGPPASEKTTPSQTLATAIPSALHLQDDRIVRLNLVQSRAERTQRVDLYLFVPSTRKKDFCQVIERNGRHEETRTPDLYRVNFEVNDLKPFPHLAFPHSKEPKTPFKLPSFDGELRASLSDLAGQ